MNELQLSIPNSFCVNPDFFNNRVARIKLKIDQIASQSSIQHDLVKTNRVTSY